MADPHALTTERVALLWQQFDAMRDALTQDQQDRIRDVIVETATERVPHPGLHRDVVAWCVAHASPDRGVLLDQDRGVVAVVMEGEEFVFQLRAACAHLRTLPAYRHLSRQDVARALTAAGGRRDFLNVYGCGFSVWRLPMQSRGT